MPRSVWRLVIKIQTERKREDHIKFEDSLWKRTLYSSSLPSCYSLWCWALYLEATGQLQESRIQRWRQGLPDSTSPPKHRLNTGLNLATAITPFQNLLRSDEDLWRDGHEVTEEGRWDLPQLKHLHRSLHAHIDEQNVQHSAAMKVGDLKQRTFLDKD